jgi:hypothetical protein
MQSPMSKGKDSTFTTWSISFTFTSPFPVDLCADPALPAMHISIPHHESVVKDIVKSSMFAKRCNEGRAKALLLCLEAPDRVSHSWRVCGKIRNIGIVRVRNGNRVIVCPALRKCLDDSLHAQVQCSHRLSDHLRP